MNQLHDDDFLQTILAELEAAGLPVPDDEFVPPPPRTDMTSEECREGVLRCLRNAIGNYAEALRFWRFWRQRHSEEDYLPTDPRKMAEMLTGFSQDSVMGRIVAEQIVKRVGELVGSQ